MRTRPLLSKYFDTDSKQRFTSDSSSPTNPPERGGQIFPLALIQYPGNRANRPGEFGFCPSVATVCMLLVVTVASETSEKKTILFLFFSVFSVCLVVCSLSTTRTGLSRIPKLRSSLLRAHSYQTFSFLLGFFFKPGIRQNTALICFHVVSGTAPPYRCELLHLCIHSFSLSSLHLKSLFECCCVYTSTCPLY